LLLFSQLTRSFCGTEQYMAPEMLLQQGHGWRMDWWALGLLMHEMMTARHPFHGATHYDTLRNMVTKTPLLDKTLSRGATDVIKSLLIKSPKTRLCCINGIEELKKKPFFRPVHWPTVMAKQNNMPYLPALQNDTDTSSFETTFTAERAVDSIGERVESGNNDQKGKGVFFSLFGFGTATETASKPPEHYKDFAFDSTAVGDVDDATQDK
jgi:serine/threonine protein kinase